MPRKRNRGLHIPGYNFCGPGTVDDGGEPINNIDRACRDHDNDPDFDYFYYNDADEKLINAVETYSSEDPVASSLISNVFRAKKFTSTKRNKARKLNNDLPSNVISTNANEGATYFSSGIMSKSKRSSKRSSSGKKRTKGKSKRKSNSKRVRLPSKTRKSRSGSKKLPKNFRSQVIRAMNPDRIYDHTSGVTYQLNSGEVSYWIDPHYEITNTRTVATDIGLGNTSRMNAIYQTMYGGTIVEGNSYYIDSAYESFLMSNYSGTPMNVKMYFLESIDMSNIAPLNWIDQSQLVSALRWPGQRGTAVVSNDAAVGHMASADTTAKNLSLKDFTEFNQHWKVMSTKKIVVQANANFKVVVKQKKRRYTQDIAPATYTKGVRRVILRIDTDLTADRTVSNVTNDVVQVKGYSFSGQSLVIQQRQIAKLGQYVNIQTAKFIENMSIVGGASSNLGTAPGYVGVQMNTDGVAKATAF